MARTRNIKPGFFLNEELAEIEPLGRLLFAGLWLLADREGRLEDRPKRIKAAVLPYDDCDVNMLLGELHKRNFIFRYEVNGEKYIEILKFCKHQHIVANEATSSIPAPPSNNAVSEQASNKDEKISNEFEKISNKDEKIPQYNLESLSLNLGARILNPESRVGGADAPPPARAPMRTRARGEGEPRLDKQFAEFWAEYPRKTAKGTAEKAYKRIKPDAALHDTMIRAVRAAKLSRDWQKDGGQFIPHPATWLNQRRWEDEPMQQARAAPIPTMPKNRAVEVAEGAIALIRARREARHNDTR